jgi:hypothetical protein
LDFRKVVCVACSPRGCLRSYFYGMVDTSERPKIEIHAKFYLKTVGEKPNGKHEKSWH